MSKPLNADDELREEIDDILQQVGNYWYCVAKETTDTRTMSEGEALDKIMQLILADRKKHELQAIIKELEWAKTASVWNIDVRVAELKQELEKL